MEMYRRIVCINKPDGHHNQHEAVTNYGYIVESESTDESQASAVVTRQEMVDWANIVGNRAYVRDSKNPSIIAYCGVNNNGHTEYLQTYKDGRWTDNLLELRECRIK